MCSYQLTLSHGDVIMQAPNLNLARKWRPKTFDSIIGQDVPVKMLKNGLYLNKFFPVYLFAGQRGCGKTSSARVFAAALNCHHLEDFQKDPQKQSLPCMTCDSCTAMTKGDHPDFIEIDAASHTGVDNVRQIIESSSYMPLAGRKKIYLIDEAHMLSKAAFNAFLKILEEPPATVTFILATTEIPKIPTTVLSRCFQLIFNPIAASTLKKHLQEMCHSEDVVIDDAALDILIEETEGSARDAINLLERVRFSSDHIAEQSVLHVLGKISSSQLLDLFKILLDQNPSQLLSHLQSITFEERNPQFLWDMIVGLCRSLVWVKYGSKNLPGNFARNISVLEELSQQCSLNRLNAIFQLLWDQEELFLKTNKKHVFLEMVLLQICQQVDVTDLKDLMGSLAGGSGHSVKPSRPLVSQNRASVQPVATSLPPASYQETSQKKTASPEPSGPAAERNVVSAPDNWKQFLQALAPLADPLLNSILGQGVFAGKQDEKKAVIVKLTTLSSFFTEKIQETKGIWQPLLKKYFDGYHDFELVKQEQKKAVQPAQSSQSVTVKPQPTAQWKKPPRPSSTPKAQTNSYLTISSPDKWPIASLLLRHFPGKIRKIGPLQSSDKKMPEQEGPAA